MRSFPINACVPGLGLSDARGVERLNQMAVTLRKAFDIRTLIKRAGTNERQVRAMDNRSERYGTKLASPPKPEELWVLVVYHEEEPLRALEQILASQGMRTRHVQSCAEAGAALRESQPPAVVLTDILHPDGTWADVVRAAGDAPLIVASRFVDVRLYLDAVEGGAYDFVVPPLTAEDLAHVVRGAILRGSRAARAGAGTLSRPTEPYQSRRA